MAIKILQTLFFIVCFGYAVTAQETQITAFDGGFADLFGLDVSIDGDYAVVGAPLQGGFGTTNAGAAYVFQNIGGVWTYVKKLTPPWGGDFGDRFGFSVAIDSNQIIVGSPGSDHYGLSDVGSAYIFSGSGTQWFLDGTIYPADGALNDRFGQVVDISGQRAIVGMANDDDHGTSSGSAYIFGYHFHNWVLFSKLTASDAHAGDAFGTGVAIDGSTAVVGAPANIGADHKHSGAVYIFAESHYGWSQSARLTHQSPDFFDHLGESVDIEGEYIIAGAPFAQDKTGHAYIFNRSGASWLQAAQLTASDGAPHDKFGLGVGITDGRAAVGAPFDDDLGAESGSMYIFEGSGMMWSETVKHNASDGAAQDKFGYQVDIDGTKSIAGAQNQDVINTDAGAAYIYMDGMPFAPPCPPVMTLSGVIQPGTYHASDHLEVAGILAMPGKVSLLSPNYIELMQLFEVPLGAELELNLQGCP